MYVVDWGLETGNWGLGQVLTMAKLFPWLYVLLCSTFFFSFFFVPPVLLSHDARCRRSVYLLGGYMRAVVQQE